MAKTKTAKSKKKGNEVHFYCEFCGTEVEKMAFQCPKCHRIFDSIKCPQCGHTGKAEDFPNGCPSCGFQSHSLAKMRDDIMQAKTKGGKETEKKPTPAAPSADKPAVRKPSPSKKPAKKKEIILPGWAYLTLIGLLSAVAVVLFVLIHLLVTDKL